MTQTVTTLKPLNHGEPIEFDHDVLADLCDRHGHRTEAVIAAILGQIEQLLGRANLQVCAGDQTGLNRTCDDLISLARTIGMRTLTRTATCVQDCLVSGDATALSACARRMLRLGQPDTIEQWTVRRDTVA